MKLRIGLSRVALVGNAWTQDGLFGQKAVPANADKESIMARGLDKHNVRIKVYSLVHHLDLMYAVQLKILSSVEEHYTRNSS